jgi:hypothetical protein
MNIALQQSQYAQALQDLLLRSQEAQFSQTFISSLYPDCVQSALVSYMHSFPKNKSIAFI